VRPRPTDPAPCVVPCCAVDMCVGCHHISQCHTNEASTSRCVVAGFVQGFVQVSSGVVWSVDVSVSAVQAPDSFFSTEQRKRCACADPAAVHHLTLTAPLDLLEDPDAMWIGGAGGGWRPPPPPPPRTQLRRHAGDAPELFNTTLLAVRNR
jgi:hypothetical protein